MLILGIESSCDETAAAVVKDGREVLSNVINTQIALHKKFGGVVPEVASRRHIETIDAVIDEALEEANVTFDDIDAIAVTYGPGLVGALLVGVSTAKALAFALNKPLVPVHHIKGHIMANFVAHKDLEPPFVCLVASGGHSHIVSVEDYTHLEIMGRTRDDAAGEAAYDWLFLELEEGGHFPETSHPEDIKVPEDGFVRNIMVRIKLLPDSD